MTSAIMIIQLFFSIVIGLYFFSLLRNQQTNKTAIEKESKKEIEKLHKLRQISLTEPLSEKTRPHTFNDIIGQEEGIKALKAALCGPNPQHVLIYGPPGVGKTCAARIVLEEAKKNINSPFKKNAKFVEMDATCVRFDERSIADPLIGSVHDPIYQGAGPLGIAGVPQPKPGAVTKAHGGILFLDEIGELHPVQMNKLLKVLEDRKVFLDSAYYNSEDTNIPKHIHDIFENGLPADFRLVGATTKSPSEITPAIRSRCLEIYFRALTPSEIKVIAKNAAVKSNFMLESGSDEIVSKYATNGRDAVNIIQLAAGIALTDNRNEIKKEDIEWVVESGHYSPRPENRIMNKPKVGYVNGLAVYGTNLGVLIGIEATALTAVNKKGNLKVTGIIEEEEIESQCRKSRRRSTARDSVDNVLTVLKKYIHIDVENYDIHLNFPGGIPIDGPSAGIAIACAIYSAIEGKMIDNKIAMTGEITILGDVKPIGGVNAKIDASIEAGAKKVLIPIDNYQQSFENLPIKVIPVSRIEEVIKHAIVNIKSDSIIKPVENVSDILSAEPAEHI